MSLGSVFHRTLGHVYGCRRAIRALDLLELPGIARVLAVGDEHGARGMTDHAFGDAAEQELAEPAVAVGAGRDQVVAAALRRMRDHRRRCALDEIEVERMAERSRFGDQ